MYWVCFLLISNLLQVNSAVVHLFNTENVLATQSYDCIYYTNNTAANNETVPYCIRTNQSVSLSRSFSENSCENSGTKWTFEELRESKVSEEEVLTWSSSIQMADRYAAYLTDGYDHSCLS